MTFSITVRTTLFANSSVILKMATNLSQDLGSMRAKYRSKNNVFTENHLVSKEPIEQFKNWFDEASQTPEILEPNAMCLATCSR